VGVGRSDVALGAFLLNSSFSICEARSTYGDLILRVEIPTTRSRSAYLQASDKHAFDWALVSCAASACGRQRDHVENPPV
jgi:CO/xanthine dehydrogenase FAD-binding subunit